MKLTYALLRKQRTHNLRYIVRTLLMKLAPGVQENKGSYVSEQADLKILSFTICCVVRDVLPACWIFSMLLLSSADFFKIIFFRKFFQEHYQSFKRWTQIRTDGLSILIWVQTVCKGYISRRKKLPLARKELEYCVDLTLQAGAATTRHGCCHQYKEIHCF